MATFGQATIGTNSHLLLSGARNGSWFTLGTSGAVPDCERHHPRHPRPGVPHMSGHPQLTRPLLHQEAHTNGGRRTGTPRKEHQLNGREPSPAELQEDLKELTQAVRESQQATIKRLDDLHTIFLPRELYEARHRSVLEAVARLEVEVRGIKDRAQRAFWTSLTSIVFPLLVLVIGAVILASGGLR